MIVADIDPWRLALARREKLADVTVDPGQEDVEQAVKQLTHGRGADSVIEAAGGEQTFQMAWKIARPNGVVAVVAMYEADQILPLPSMYGKNLVFKTGGVDARHCAKLVELLEKGRLRTDFLITHRGPLDRILEGYRVFSQKEDSCLKWVVTSRES